MLDKADVDLGLVMLLLGVVVAFWFCRAILNIAARVFLSFPTNNDAAIADLVPLLRIEADGTSQEAFA